MWRRVVFLKFPKFRITVMSSSAGSYSIKRDTTFILKVGKFLIQGNASHHGWLQSSAEPVEITNKIQPCNRIYYSRVYWRLNMFRAAYRSLSGALTVFAVSGLYKHVVTGRCQGWVGIQTWQRPVTTCVYTPEAANTVKVPDDERCAAGNMLSLQ